MTLAEIESEYCEVEDVNLSEILVQSKYNENSFNASAWYALNSKVLFTLFPPDVLSTFIMSKLSHNKDAFFEFKKAFMNSFSAAMFYSFHQNSEGTLQDLSIDLRTGKCYIDNVTYDRGQVGLNSQSLKFNSIRLTRAITHSLGEYCLEGVVATHIAAMTKIVTADD